MAALKDQYSSLAESEQFAVVMSEIKRVVPRLTSMAFKMNFADMVMEIKPEIVSAAAALEEIMQSRKFAKIIELILLIGNFMNAGSRNEMTIGFEMSFMSKLTNTKTSDNRETLMHFLVEIIQKQFPDVVDFADELLHINKAVKVSEDTIQKTMNQLNKSLKQLDVDLKNAQSDKSVPPNDKFVGIMMPFAATARQQCEVLEGMYKKLTSMFQQTAKYYCFDPKKYTVEDFFGDIKVFVDNFTQAVKDIAKQKENEEKAKRAKEAQEKREREKQEKMARKKTLIDISTDDDQEGVMDNLMEALKTGSAFNVSRDKRGEKKRTPRAAGAERRAQLTRSRSRQSVTSAEIGNAVHKFSFDQDCIATPSRIPHPFNQLEANQQDGISHQSQQNHELPSSIANHKSKGATAPVPIDLETPEVSSGQTKVSLGLSEAEELLQQLQRL